MLIDHDTIAALERAWQPARDAGVMGGASLEALRHHAAGFLLGDWKTPDRCRFVDCGAGAGALGLLLALEMPSSRWSLVDASEMRCELALTAVSAVSLQDRVNVVHSRIEDLASQPDWRESQDGLVARSFGPVPELAECALPLLKMNASLVVSVSAATRLEWQRLDLLATTGCEVSSSWQTSAGNYLSVQRHSPAPEHLPRRLPARRRNPLPLTLSW